MKLIFFDEAKNEPAYPRYHIGGVCVDESDLARIEGEMAQLAEKTFGSQELTRATEFHAADIYHRKNNFKPWNDFNNRISVLAHLIDILSLPEVRLIDIQVNCDRLYGGQTPEEVAFMFLCERANDLVKRQKGLGMLIGDRENDRVAENYARILSGYRSHGTDFEFGRDIRNLVDSVHFTHSHLSRFLQLADAWTWVLQFSSRNQNSEDTRHKALLDVLRRENVNLFPAKYKEWPK